MMDKHMCVCIWISLLSTATFVDGIVADAGDRVCMYGIKPYRVGDVFSTLDGCNKCLCREPGMQCTAKACSQSGYAQASKEPLYGECMYDGGWYRYHSQWLARDGCNTCYCNSIGNYMGGHVCTSSKCTHSSNIITG